MAVVQGLCRDLADALHAAGNGGAGGTVVIQALHQLLIALPFRVILDHADLLTDDALLLLHRLVGKVGNGHKGQQDLQVLIELFGRAEIVAGNGVGGKGVGLRAVFRQLLQGVALGGIKHFMLQIVGETGSPLGSVSHRVVSPIRV